MKHMINKNSVCPFYKHEDAQVIYCYGVQEGSVIHLAFASKTDAKSYKERHCRNNFKVCLIAKMLDEEERTNER